MADRLVIVRHAKTESRKEGLDDLDRKVTEAGMRACEARLPRALGLLDAEEAGSIAVWSSPATRALQTAAVVAEALGTDEIDVHGSLYSDETGTFLGELADAGGTVVAVGHNPFLEELYRGLSGHGQEIGKAAVASFAFDGDGAASLEWFVQGPDHHRWKTLVDIEHVLAHAWEGIDGGRLAFLSDPLDPETLHRYRIALRVARSLVQFLAPYLRKGRAVKAEAALGDLARETSRLRELDVFAAEVASTGACDADAGRLALEVEVARNDARSRLMRALGSEEDAARLRRARRFLKHPAWKRAVEERGLGTDELAGSFGLAVAALRDELSACDFADAEATHHVRKRSKRLRYVSRELKGLLGEGTAGEGREAKALQERLGDICDARVNGALAESFGAEGLADAERERAESLVAAL